MPEETTTEKAKKVKVKRGPRANYQRDLDRVTVYLETIIGFMDRTPDEADVAPVSEFMRGQIRAYRDALSFIEGAK